MQKAHGFFLFLMCLAAWAAAAWLRLRALDHAVVGSDSLGPYLQAWALRIDHVQAGHLPRPPNPESGDWLWVSALPLVHGARSLGQLFELRFVAGAAIAPLGMIAAWAWAAPDHLVGLWTSGTARQWSAALAAGAVLAVDPGLTDTLISGARTYGAPELITAATMFLGLAWRGSRSSLALAALALVVAADHHPLAAGMALGAMLSLPGLADRHGVEAVAAAFVLGGLAALPRLIRLVGILDCGAGPVECLAEIARSNVDDQVVVEQIVASALNDRFLVDLGPIIAAGVLIGVLVCGIGPGVWTLGGAAGLLLIAGINGYLQGYHLRILAGPLAVAAAVGLARIWPLALAWGGWAVFVLHPRVPVGPDPGAAARHDQLATKLAELEGPLWVDRVWWEGEPALDASAVVLSAVLQGQDPEGYRVGGQSDLVILSIGGVPSGKGERVMALTPAEGGTPWSVLRFEDPGSARMWVRRTGLEPIQLGGAWDWMVALHPDETDLEGVRW